MNSHIPPRSVFLFVFYLSSLLMTFMIILKKISRCLYVSKLTFFKVMGGGEHFIFLPSNVRGDAVLLWRQTTLTQAHISPRRSFQRLSTCFK